MISPSLNRPDTLLMSSASSSRQMSMQVNAKAFKILSSSLYSNRVRAIIRELCANAWDSHVEAGNTDNFDVHLPTTMEPHFSIRDYGTGMSEETMNEVFNCLFSSTKTETNAQSGMLGLGSKSPFSYTSMMLLHTYL